VSGRDDWNEVGRGRSGGTANTRCVVVTGGAGFLGSHVCDALVESGAQVVCVDNLSTGSTTNLIALEGRETFGLVVADVSQNLDVLVGPVNAVLHFASPASPPDYLSHPLETLAAGAEGTRHALELAAAHNARFVLASTSEVYGEPAIHPQPESYWGSVNPIGPRSVYDEAKRFAEALTMAWHRTHNIDVGIVRIFNTYGPRMRPSDGRVVSNFLVQAIEGRPLTVYGDGTQTRSLCFVDDTISGILALLDSGLTGPVNIGNPDEHTVLELAQIVLELTGSASQIVHEPLPENDPTRRRPDISMARRQLGWEPVVSLRDGLRRTAESFVAAGVGVVGVEKLRS
jgi:dTDP-glucose 4,6-dehydratase